MAADKTVKAVKSKSCSEKDGEAAKAANPSWCSVPGLVSLGRSCPNLKLIGRRRHRSDAM
jgi:hypothetical protein